MKVAAAIPQYKEVEVEVSNSIKIVDLKKKICRKLGIDAKLTSLLFQGRPLLEESKLKDVDLQSQKLTVDYMWARHLLLWGTTGQSLIEKSQILLAGAGAIGNEVAKNLVMLGVKRLAIVDHDLIETSNLSRTIFFGQKDVGKPKANVLSNKIQEYYPYTHTKAYCARVEEIPTSVYLNSNLLVSGLDNVPSRMHLVAISRRYSIPMVDAGTIGYETRVQVYVPPDSPCPICPLPPGNYGQMAGLRNPCTAPLEEMKIPSLPTSMSLVSSIQSQEAMKLILGYQTFLRERKWPQDLGEPLKGVLLVDLRYNRYSKLELNKNPRCMVCGKDGIARNTIERYEISLSQIGDSTSRLQECISQNMAVKPSDVVMFKENRSRLVPIEIGKEMKTYGFRKGQYVYAVLKKEHDTFSESVFKLK